MCYTCVFTLLDNFLLFAIFDNFFTIILLILLLIKVVKYYIENTSMRSEQGYCICRTFYSVK